MLKIVVVAEEKCAETCRICIGHVTSVRGQRLNQHNTQLLLINWSPRAD